MSENLLKNNNDSWGNGKNENLTNSMNLNG